MPCYLLRGGFPAPLSLLWDYASHTRTDFSRIRKVSAGVGRNDKAEPWRTPQRGAAGTPPRKTKSRLSAA